MTAAGPHAQLVERLGDASAYHRRSGWMQHALLFDEAAAALERADALLAELDAAHRHRNVAAAAWAYRVAYEAYWGEVMAWPERYTVEQKQRYLAEVVAYQGELDAALAALDDNPGDFVAAKAAAKEAAALASRAAPPAPAPAGHPGDTPA